jgi:hypothetical protein
VRTQCASAIVDLVLTMTQDIGEAPTEPSWRLRFEDRADYLYAEVDGPEDSLQITIDYWRNIDAECRRRNTRLLLVCDRLRGAPATPEEFRQLAATLKGGALDAVRIAFHEPVSDHLRFVEHGELTFREAGFTLRVFGSEREAEVWLRYGQS